MEYWLIVTSPDNFKWDRANLNFKLQGLPFRFRKQVPSKIGRKKTYFYSCHYRSHTTLGTVARRQKG